MFRKVENRRVRHTWKCHADGCEATENEVKVLPNFYEHCGTPVCSECGCDMKYAYTEVDIENCQIP
jgi:hypothetical protein